jgi:hypothetical protein
MEHDVPQLLRSRAMVALVIKALPLGHGVLHGDRVTRGARSEQNLDREAKSEKHQSFDQAAAGSCASLS